MQTHNKSLLNLIRFLSLIINISLEDQIIKLKVNQPGEIFIINNTKIPNPDEIYINSELNFTNTSIITIENIAHEIELRFTNKLTTCENMFSTLSHIKEIDLTNFDSSECTNMDFMFNDCIFLEKIQFGNFNTGQVTSMCNMFANCSSLVDLDISGFNSSKVTNINLMFYACEKLRYLDLSNFNSSSVTTAYGLFMDCFNLENINLTGFKTNNIKNFCLMFNNCSSLKSLDLSSFDTYFADCIGYMFYGCSSLTSLNLSNFYSMYAFWIMDYMFGQCINLEYINLYNIHDKGGQLTFSNKGFLEGTPENLVMCYQLSNARGINTKFNEKKCTVFDCGEDWKKYQKKINASTGECMISCNEGGNNLYEYNNKCYNQCPQGTKENIANFTCEDIIIEKTEYINDINQENTIKITNVETAFDSTNNILRSDIDTANNDSNITSKIISTSLNTDIYIYIIVILFLSLEMNVNSIKH